MRIRPHHAFVLALPLAAPALAQAVPEATPGASAPTGAQLAPQLAPELSPELNALLTRIEARAQTVKTMKSRLRLTTQQGDLLGDKQVRFGLFQYQVANPKASPPTPAQTRIDFDRVVVDGKAEKVDIRYIFDGFWLLESSVKEKEQTHNATRREIRAPNDPKDALALGGGILPLPLSFDKASILSRFDVKLGETGPTEDNRPAVRLILTPKAGTKMKVSQMRLTFAKDTLDPIAATSVQGEDSTEILLSKPEFNPELPPGAFDTTAPKGQDWQVQVEPLK